MDRITIPSAPSLSPSSPSTPLRRDPSYRKPVPEFMPSPPTSPTPASPGLPQVQVTATESEEEGRPPLPGDWQDVLRQALVDQEKRDNFNTDVPSSTATSVLRPQNSAPITVEEPEKTLTTPVSPNGSKRRLPQSYRPPTPPLGTAARKRKLLDEGASADLLSIPSFSNLAKSSEIAQLHPPSTFATAGSSRASLHPLSTQASYRTDKTNASSVVAGSARTNDTSHNDANREDDWHDLPVLPMFIVKPPTRGHGSGIHKTGSLHSSSQKSWTDSCRSKLRSVGGLFRDALSCFVASS